MSIYAYLCHEKLVVLLKPGAQFDVDVTPFEIIG